MISDTRRDLDRDGGGREPIARVLRVILTPGTLKIR